MKNKPKTTARNFSVSQDVDGTYLLRGELTIHDLDYFKEFMESSVARSGKVALSFAELAFADTASLQFLIAFKKGMGHEKGLMITDISSEMEKILEISGLGSFLG